MSLTLEMEFIHSEIQIKKALPLLHMYHSRVLFLTITATLREWELVGLQLKEKYQSQKKEKKKKIIQGDFHFTQRLGWSHPAGTWNHLSFHQLLNQVCLEGRIAAWAGRRATRRPHHPRESENSSLRERDGKEPRQEHPLQGSPVTLATRGEGRSHLYGQQKREGRVSLKIGIQLKVK